MEQYPARRSLHSSSPGCNSSLHGIALSFLREQLVSCEHHSPHTPRWRRIPARRPRLPAGLFFLLLPLVPVGRLTQAGVASVNVVARALSVAFAWHLEFLIICSECMLLYVGFVEYCCGAIFLIVFFQTNAIHFQYSL